MPELFARRRTVAAVGVTALVAAALSIAAPGAAEPASAPPSAPSAAESSRAPAASPGAESPISDNIIVVWRATSSATARASARAESSTVGVRLLGSPRFQLLRPAAGQSTTDALAVLQADPDVSSAERDGFSQVSAVPNDPDFDQEWGLRNTGAGIAGVTGAKKGADSNVVPAWARTKGDPDVVVADLDGGYNFASPDLGPVAWTNPGETANGLDDDGNGFVDDVHGFDFVGSNADVPTFDNDPTDDDLIGGGHGVHTAGTIGAKGNNGVGITGVAQDIRIMPLRVCSFSPSAPPPGSGRCPFSSQIAAINYAGANGAKVANMSLGGTSRLQTVADALASNPHTLFVIAAGNDGLNNDSVAHYPCNFNPAVDSAVAGRIDNVLCVAASDQKDARASFSDFGHTSVDIAAPGTEILSTYLAHATVWHEDFQANNFASRWSGSGFGRASSGDGPLTSFGMNDSPGAAPAAGLHEITSTFSQVVPAGSGACTFSGLRFVRQGNGDFLYTVLANGVAIPTLNGVAPQDTVGSSMTPFFTVPFNASGMTVSVRFDYTAAAGATASQGIWLDNLNVECNSPLGTPAGYEFLQGTSMATPHVTGAAALLWSLKPSATVTQVKNAILKGAHHLPAWKTLVSSGGRLDVAGAMNKLVPLPCVVPALKGKSLGAAKTALSKAHCSLGKVTKPKGVATSKLKVKSSSPPKGTHKPAGFAVKLTLVKK